MHAIAAEGSLDFSFASKTAAPAEAEADVAPFLPPPTLPQNGANGNQGASVPSPVSARVMALAERFRKVPELTLDEMVTIQDVFESVMGDKEVIMTCFELRVLLARLGIYPTEAELTMVLRANRERVSISALCQYLRFYKKRFACEPASQSTAARSVGPPPPGEFPAFDTTPLSATGDADTLRAFVSLGGNEDGTGSISAARLSELVYSFSLTIDMEAMIAAVDVEGTGLLDFPEFCALWRLPEGPARRGSILSFSTLNATSPITDKSYSSVTKAVLPLQKLASGVDSWTTAISPPMSACTAAPVRATQQYGSTSSRPDADQATYPPPNVRTAKSGEAAADTAPLSDAEHLNLLQMFLFPEMFESKARRARLDVESLTINHNRLPQLPCASHNKRGFASRLFDSPGNRNRSRSSWPFRASKGRQNRRNRKNVSLEDEDDFLLQKGAGGVYQPPSPMILSQRTKRSGLQKNGCPPNASGKAYTFNKAGKVTLYSGGPHIHDR